MLNRPEVYNAIDYEPPVMISDAIAATNADPEVHAIILARDGKAFCAGYDLVFDTGGDGAGIEAGATILQGKENVHPSSSGSFGRRLHGSGLMLRALPKRPPRRRKLVLLRKTSRKVRCIGVSSHPLVARASARASERAGATMKWSNATCA